MLTNATGTTHKPEAASAAWHLIAAMLVATVLWITISGLSFDWASAALPIFACLGLAAVAAFYRFRRPDEAIAASLIGVAQLVAFSSVAAPLSYAVASTGGPLWDETLLAWDRGLGLDWQSYLAFVNARPWLGLAYTAAYQSLLMQMVVAVVVLGLTGRLTACREFVLAVIVAGLITIVISALMPAVAMFVHLGLRPQDYPNLNPAAAFVHVAHLTGLRDGTLRVISLTGAEGIITFPSFHAALGVIFATAFWQVRWARWPGLAINVLLIAATPIDGGHYFVDVLAGAGIAALAMLSARVLHRRGLSRTGRLLGASQTESTVQA